MSNRSRMEETETGDPEPKADVSAWSWVRSGKRKRVPLTGAGRAESGRMLKGANWSGKRETSLWSMVRRTPEEEFVAEEEEEEAGPDMGGTWVPRGSRTTREEPVIKEGVSVRWKDAQNPRPNLPVASGVPAFVPDPMAAMAAKSASVKGASLYARSAGPWRGAMDSARMVSAPWERVSRTKERVVAPASDAFWMSSARMEGPHG